MGMMQSYIMQFESLPAAGTDRCRRGSPLSVWPNLHTLLLLTLSLSLSLSLMVFMFVFLFCMLVSILCILYFCIVLCIVSTFFYSCLFTIFVKVYRPLPPGGNPIAENKYRIISNKYHIILQSFNMDL